MYVRTLFKQRIVEPADIAGLTDHIRMLPRLEWDEGKNRTNRLKHGISFEEAGELFVSGADYVEIFDDKHSFDEDRFICIGPIPSGIVEVVVVTEPAENVLRLISARSASRREALLYRSFTEGKLP